MTQGVSVVSEWSGGIRDTNVFKAGPASLRVDGGMASQHFEGFAGCRIRVSGWIKTSGKARAQVAIQSFNENFSRNTWQQIIYRQDNTDWTYFDGNVEVPDWCRTMELRFLVEGEGSAWLDEVGNGEEVDEGRPVTAEKEMRANPPGKGKPWKPAWCIYNWRSAWFDRHKAFKERSSRGGIDVIAYGDSITEGWGDGAGRLVKKIKPSATAVNYGIGGDSTRQLLWRIAGGETDGAAPSLIILAIGTNNLYDDVNGGGNEEIVRGVGAVAEELAKRHPQAKILILSILPRQNDYFCGRIEEINAGLAKLAVPGKILFHDRTDDFLESPGVVKKELFNNDMLHLSASGYTVWEEDVYPVLSGLLD